MKLKIYALVAEIVGGLTVFFGLIFVGFELRQNTLMQRITATQTHVADYDYVVNAFPRYRLWH